MIEMPADNKRFGKIGGGKVTARISVRPLIVGDNPNSVQSNPNFAKPPGRYRQCSELQKLVELAANCPLAENRERKNSL